MPCEEAARLLALYLWEYEKKEILEFETIYFFNVAERKKGRYSSQQKND